MTYVTNEELPATVQVPRAERSGGIRNATWISPRFLLLFSCLLITLASPNPSYLWAKVGALVAAALMSGVALLRPLTVRDPDLERRATQLIVGVLLEGM